VAEATGQTSAAAPSQAAQPKKVVTVPAGDAGLFERLRDWRRERASADGVPPYVVFHDKTLVAIAQAKPRSAAALSEIAGVGPAKMERYADELLAVVATGD
jgi:superfamily II DNA helicase RecQ